MLTQHTILVGGPMSGERWCITCGQKSILIPNCGQKPQKPKNKTDKNQKPSWLEYELNSEGRYTYRGIRT